MKGISKFLRIICLFLLPPVVILVGLEGLLWNMGELKPSREVLLIQTNAESGSEIIYQRGLISQQFNIYKWAGIEHHKPEILAVGSSRVLKFRGFMFTPFEASFYNAGGLIQNAQDLHYYSEALQKAEIHVPRVLILGIDPWWYKKDNRASESWLKEERRATDAVFVPEEHVLAFRKILLQNPTWLFRSKKYPQNIGLGAQLNGGGFRADGSKKISPEIIEDYILNPQYVDRESPPVINRIRDNLTGRFTISPIDTLAFIQTLEDLEAISKMGVKVVVYFPPFASESWEALEESEPLASWWDFYKSQMADSVQKLFPNSTIRPVSSKMMGLTDRYFIDGFHPGEVFVAHQWLSFIRNNPNLNESMGIDIKKLSERLSNTPPTPLSFSLGEEVNPIRDHQ